LDRLPAGPASLDGAPGLDALRPGQTAVAGPGASGGGESGASTPSGPVIWSMSMSRSWARSPPAAVGGCSAPLSESAITRPTKAGQKSKHRHPVRSDSIRRGVPAGLKEIANSAAPYGAAATTSSRSSTTTPPTAPPKPSTDAWKHCAATPADSETSPTTAGAHYCTAAPCTHSSMHSEPQKRHRHVRTSWPARCCLGCRSVCSFNDSRSTARVTKVEEHVGDLRRFGERIERRRRGSETIWTQPWKPHQEPNS
jgi:hypothetical protein